MTTINTSLISLFSNTTASKPPSSNDNGSFDALLTRVSATTTPTQAAATGDNTAQLLQYIQQMVSNTEGTLADMLFGSSTTQASNNVNNTFATSNSVMDDPFVSGAGPLPAFLQQVDVAYNLNDTQKLALRNIALNNKDATHTPADIQKIANELAQAGIGTAPVST